MKKLFFIALACGIGLLAACSQKEGETASDGDATNPFFTEWTTPFGVPPFDKIKLEHYKPALDSGLKAHSAEIEAIKNSPDAPTFENTILALENSGELFNRVYVTFYNVVGADGDEAMNAIDEEYAPIISAHFDNIYMDTKLFERVKAIYDKRDAIAGLDADDKALIKHYYNVFMRAGTGLADAQKAELKKINEGITKLTTEFGKRLLAENNAFVVTIEDKKDLAGLPQSSIDAAAELAKSKGADGKWMFTTSKPSWIPFMQYSENRALREKMYKGYVNRGNNGNGNDTKDIIEQIAVLRTKKAQLLGYPTWADYIISDNMAKTAKAARNLIDQVAKTTIPYAKAEAVELQKLADKMGDKIKIEPWDWWYYTEKLRKEKYDLEEEVIKPYFSYKNTLQGCFDLAGRLYGLTFKELKDMPVYNKEMTCYEVFNPDGSHLSVIYFDPYPRETKRAGAWMNGIREEFYKDGKRVAPVVINVCNFPRPTGDVPSLLSVDDVETTFHEFGHAIQGMLANTKYKSTSGTNVSRDYVELPSQIMENWACHPEFIKTWAKHYKTGEVIPDSLVAKIVASSKFNQGFITMELIAATILDLDWHSIKDTNKRNAAEFEKESMKKLGLIPQILPRYSSWYFNHIWGSDFGYSAGYYGYTWSAVLDADAFAAFVETGDICNKELATKFKDNVLSKGASYDSDLLYRQFRGKDATPAAFFARKGFVKK